jgi:hypothetical protein
VASTSTVHSPAHEESADRQPHLAVSGEQVLVPVRDDAEHRDATMQRDWLTIMGFGPTHPPDLRLRRSSRAGHLWDALSHAHDTLGFAQAAGGDEVFRQLVLARIIEPASELDSLRVLDEVGVKPPSYATVKRRLPMFAETSWRQQVAAARAAHAGLGPASLVLYDVSTLYLETDAGDGFREPGFSEERRPGAADHHRPADRRDRIPVDGQRL